MNRRVPGLPGSSRFDSGHHHLDAHNQSDEQRPPGTCGSRIMDGCECGSPCRLVDVAAQDAARAGSITIDMTTVEQLDTLGAWLLERLARSSKRDGKGARFNGLKAQHRGLVDEMQRVNLQPQPPVEKPSRTIIMFDNVGSAVQCLHHCGTRTFEQNHMQFLTEYFELN